MWLRRRRVTIVLLGCAFAAVYLPALGHGFLKDDFGWIQRSAIQQPAEAVALFTRFDPGFYRPVVALSFALDRQLFGLHPFGYAATNLLLLAAVAVELCLLVRQAGLAIEAGVFAAALWAFNFHGIAMALLWISGRTELLLTLLALLAVRALLRRRPWLAAGWAFLAMCSKEEAVLLPLMLAIWGAALVRGSSQIEEEEERPSSSSRLDWRVGLQLAWPCFASLVVYLGLRMHAGAMTPRSAPPFYRFDFHPSSVAMNVLQYADRTCTFPVAVLLLLALAIHRRPRLTAAERRLVLPAAAWLVLGYGLTLWLPVRSSLYVCFPAIGAAVLAAAIASALWREAAPALQRRLLVAGLALPFLLWPVYHARNERWVAPADRTRLVLAQIAARADELPGSGTIVVDDEETGRTSVAGAFGVFLPTAVSLVTGRDLSIRVEPPPPGAGPDRQPGPPAAEVRERLILHPGGRLQIRRRSGDER